MYWVGPESIHTHTTGGISEVRRGGDSIVWNSKNIHLGGFIGLEFGGHGGVVVFRSGLAQGEYQVSKSIVTMRLITQKKGKQSTRGKNLATP